MNYPAQLDAGLPLEILGIPGIPDRQEATP
jgi:hypothetical protein